MWPLVALAAYVSAEIATTARLNAIRVSIAESLRSATERIEVLETEMRRLDALNVELRRQIEDGINPARFARFAEREYVDSATAQVFEDVEEALLQLLQPPLANKIADPKLVEPLDPEAAWPFPGLEGNARSFDKLGAIWPK